MMLAPCAPEKITREKCFSGSKPSAGSPASWPEAGVGSREALREAVARGPGAVSQAEFIPGPRFVTVRIDGDPAMTGTYLYHARERRRSLLIASFLQAQRLAPHELPPA